MRKYLSWFLQHLSTCAECSSCSCSKWCMSGLCCSKSTQILMISCIVTLRGFLNFCQNVFLKIGKGWHLKQQQCSICPERRKWEEVEEAKDPSPSLSIFEIEMKFLLHLIAISKICIIFLSTYEMSCAATASSKLSSPQKFWPFLFFHPDSDLGEKMTAPANFLRRGRFWCPPMSSHFPS